MTTKEEHGQLRGYRLTGSMAKRLMTGNYSTWNKLLDEIRSPPTFGEPTSRWPAALAWGVKYEPMALAKFWEKHPTLDVDDPRFVPYYDQSHALRAKWIGVSPDRMLRPAGAQRWDCGLEAKCPYDEGKHERWKRANVVPAEHRDQCYWGVLTTGVGAWTFMSYDPRTDDYFETALVIRQAYLEDMLGKADRFIDVLDTGGRFEAFTTGAKSLRSMFRKE